MFEMTKSTWIYIQGVICDLGNKNQLHIIAVTKYYQKINRLNRKVDTLIHCAHEDFLQYACGSECGETEYGRQKLALHLRWHLTYVQKT
jgi:hypothetical protein